MWSGDDFFHTHTENAESKWDLILMISCLLWYCFIIADLRQLLTSYRYNITTFISYQWLGVSVRSRGHGGEGGVLILRT